MKMQKLVDALCDWEFRVKMDALLNDGWKLVPGSIQIIPTHNGVIYQHFAIVEKDEVGSDVSCAFCSLPAHTRRHHIVPRCKGGTTTVPCCETCESYIHKTWNNNQLRDVYNSVDVILADEGFQKFLNWRRKQPAATVHKSDAGKYRNKRKYT
jgi:hypothetical protein